MSNELEGVSGRVEGEKLPRELEGGEEDLKQKNMTRLSVRLPVDLWDELDRYAKETGRSKSSIVQEALERHLKYYERPLAFAPEIAFGEAFNNKGETD